MTIDKFNFAGKKAIVRVDFNVPLDENGKITDDTRIRGALPTLKKVLADGGSLIIMSHMGKPKGKVNAKYSLSQIVDAVSEKLGVPVQFAPDCAKAGDAAAALKPGEVLLLENLRFYPEEEGKPVGIDKEDPAYEDAKKAMKASQKEFAKTLASYADCYINDAFGTAHRKHASTAVIADYFDADNKMLGYLMEKEVQAVDNILKDIKRPFTAIMGGSKVSTKIGIIENLMDKVDNLILCGGMTYTFAKAQGGKIGNSIVEDDKLDLALELMKKALIENARGYDAKDDRLSGNPNQMNIQSMYSDIDLDANGMETEFQAAFEQLLWFINQDFSNRGKGDFDGEDIQITFDRDILINESEAIDNCSKSVGILSDETIVEQHPWTNDVELELARLKKEKEEAMEQAQEYSGAFGARNQQNEGMGGDE